MRKKIGLFLLLLSMIFVLTGCGGGGGSDDPVSQTKTYKTNFKVINSSDEIITTAAVKVDGKTGNGGEGVYSFNLTRGSHTVDVTDTAGKYFDYKDEITVSRDNEIFSIPLMKNIKVVEVRVLDNSDSPVSDSVVEIAGENPSSINNNRHFYNLEIGETYSITAKDKYDYYQAEIKSITVDENTDIVPFKLDSTALGSVSGTLTLPSAQNSLPIMNAVVSYGSKEVVTDETGYFRLDGIPTGNINLTINTLFTEEQTKNINISGNYTLKNEEKIIEFSSFPESEVLNGDPMYQGNNNKLPKWDLIPGNMNLTYKIDTSSIDSLYPTEKFNMINNIKEGLEEFEKVFEVNNNKTITFSENTSNPDIIINIVPDGSIGGVGAGSSSVTMDSTTSEITESIISLNAEYMIERNQAKTITTHEISHTLGISHSYNSNFLMYSTASNSSIGGFDNYINSNIDEHKIFGLLYSIPVGSDDFITN